MQSDINSNYSNKNSNYIPEYNSNEYKYSSQYDREQRVPYHLQDSTSSYYQDFPQQTGRGAYQPSSQYVNGTVYYNQPPIPYVPSAMPNPGYIPNYGPYVPYYVPENYLPEEEVSYVSDEELDMSSTKNFEQTSFEVDDLVTEQDFFEDSYLSQGRVGFSGMPRTFRAKSLQEDSNKPQQYIHENGIFGAYCLEDVRCISSLVLKQNQLDCVSYDCFNYETVTQITQNKSICTSKSAPSKHLDMYYNNKRDLSSLQNQGLLSFSLHYSSKNNDLLQERNVKVDESQDWDKFNRFFNQNMIFFNPYYENGQGTTRLMNAFFDYARTNLDDNGVVTIMWNPNRRDNLAQVKMGAIAMNNGFKIVKKLSGVDFAEATKFNHLKNSTSLNTAVSTANTTQVQTKVTIVAKKTDTIIMFKKKIASSDIPNTNMVANALIAELPEVNVFVP